MMKDFAQKNSETFLGRKKVRILNILSQPVHPHLFKESVFRFLFNGKQWTWSYQNYRKVQVATYLKDKELNNIRI